MGKYTNVARRFSNGIVVVNTTPHPLSFLSPEGEKVVVPTSVPAGERTGFAVLNAKAVETEVAPHLVKTRFEGTEEGERILDEICQEFSADYEEGRLFIVGSLVAANAYHRVVGMVPAPGYERVPPDQKLMSTEKFNAGEA